MNILLIEDNLVDRMAFLRMVEKEDLDCNLEVVESISEAKNYLARKKYQLVVCDLNLPDGTAFDLFAAFAKNDFILLSGFVDADLKEKAKRAGIYKVIAKTGDLKQFSKIIDTINQKMGKRIVQNKSSADQPQNDRFNAILSHLKRTFDDNPVYIADIIHSFLNENPKLISRLSLAAEINDQQQIIKTAHQLKSGYMLMGLKELEHLAAELETGIHLEIEDLNNRIQSIIEQSKRSYISLNAALLQIDHSN